MDGPNRLSGGRGVVDKPTPNPNVLSLKPSTKTRHAAQRTRAKTRELEESMTALLSEPRLRSTCW